jgi:tRNA (mo5U34)-methyltransferase
MTLQSLGKNVTGGGETGRVIASMAPWFHNLHLPGGVETAPDHPLGDFPAFKWERMEPSLPDDMRGVSALDIGCNAGFYSFELAARGASVLAIDHDEHYLRQASWAARHLDPEGRVEFRRMGVYELDSLEQRFDLILFLGVLYHLRHPLLALDLVAERLRGRLVLQTLTMPGEEPIETPRDVSIDERGRLTAPGWPRAAFIEQSLAGDPTNWWAFDDACVRAVVRSCGLRVSDAPGHETYLCERAGEPDRQREARVAELRAARGR